MWESRPLPKIVRDPPCRSQREGVFCMAPATRRACPIPQRPDFYPAALPVLSPLRRGFFCLGTFTCHPARPCPWRCNDLWSSPALWGEPLTGTETAGPFCLRPRFGGEPAKEAARAVRIVQAGRGMSLAGDPGRDMGGGRKPLRAKRERIPRRTARHSHTWGSASAGRLTLQSCQPDGYPRAELMEQRGGRRTDEQSDARGRKTGQTGKRPLFRCS